MQLRFVGSTELVTDMHLNYLTPEKIYLCTNLETPKNLCYFLSFASKYLIVTYIMNIRFRLGCNMDDFIYILVGYVYFWAHSLCNIYFVQRWN